MTFKRYMKAGAVLAVAALGLSACGTGTTEPAAEESPAASTAPAEESTPAEEPAGEPVEIQYLHRLPDGEGMTPVSEIVQRWNDENPNIQVTATKFDGKAQEMITKLETDVNANNAPCLAQLGYAEVPEMFVKGLVEDVTEEAKKYEGDFGGAFGQMSVGGTMVGLPQDSGPLVYLYNEAEFEKLGIEVPTDSASFVEAAKKAAAAGKYIADFTPDEAQYWLSGQAAGAGAVWYGAENDQWVVKTDTAESQAVAAMWQELLDNKAVLTHDRWGDAYGAALVDGSLIGNIAAAWETGFALDALDGTAFEGQWRVAQMPAINGSELTGPNGGSGVAVMKGCANPAEAMEFNAWFNTQVDDLAQQGLVPAATAVAATPEKMSRQFGGQDVMAELVKANERMSTEFGYIPGFSAVGPKMAEAAAAAANGSGKVADVFVAAQAASIAALQDAGLSVAS
ncbi:ABC transporter substrate-binding protein [Tessaracoccus sp. ZS01]|uniref:ABC transporter substrate-binding protein n=1 Tax=Tessaracoccus sp. ZS01 TaxID=1906324 RepID=UPI00096CE0B3|nr:extracellular solute-binding protein [Tessaracoccus sp. ZS01]MCG6567152.1 ABC transporter substrate-binding protein [Tessaracoccus sp. ZS01]OMG57554.1 ABC transporter substrate-binding protein [Tessaracoccus sp. ZS01]